MDVKAGYKRTEVGLIPEDWNVSPIGELFSISAGGDFDAKRSRPDRDSIYCFPIYSNALTNCGLYGYASFADHPANSITITARGAVGVANFRDHPYTAIGRVLVALPRQDAAGRYFAEVINNRVKFANESTGVPQLTAPQVSKYHLPVPPLPEQCAIAEALSEVDALLGALDRLIAKKRDLKQAAMQQLLTGQTRLPGFNDEWMQAVFGDVASIRNEKVVADLTPHDTVCVELEHIESGTGRLLGTTPATGPSAKYTFARGDVLFGRLRAYLKKYWYASFNGVCSTEIWPIVPRDQEVSSSFLSFIVQQDSFIETAGVAYGTHMPRSDWNVLRRFSVPLPSLPEQSAIAEVLTDMDAELAALAQRREKTRALKQAMMQELLTGRTRLV